MLITNQKVRLGNEWVFFNECLCEGILERCELGKQLKESERKAIWEVLEQHKEVFSHDPKAPRVCNSAIHLIKTEPGCISFEKARRIPAKNVDEINKQVKQMLTNDIIRPSESQYNSNPVLVGKKSDTAK